MKKVDDMVSAHVNCVDNHRLKLEREKRMNNKEFKEVENKELLVIDGGETIGGMNVDQFCSQLAEWFGGLFK